jgi:predicted RNase H-like HicB family nuclease
MNYTIECEKEVDGRWLAEVIELPGLLGYGATKNEAIVKVETLALRVNVEFEPKSKAQKACQALAASRREDIRSGKVSMVLGNEALARVRARLN